MRMPEASLLDFLITWERIDDCEPNLLCYVVAGDVAEAWSMARAEARLALGIELNRWTVTKVERLTAAGRELVA